MRSIATFTLYALLLIINSFKDDPGNNFHIFCSWREQMSRAYTKTGSSHTLSTINCRSMASLCPGCSGTRHSPVLTAWSAMPSWGCQPEEPWKSSLKRLVSIHGWCCTCMKRIFIISDWFWKWKAWEWFLEQLKFWFQIDKKKDWY